ncbi:hypothetical protein ACWFQ7_33450 [Streptomyces bacillaris]
MGKMIFGFGSDDEIAPVSGGQTYTDANGDTYTTTARPDDSSDR